MSELSPAPARWKSASRLSAPKQREPSTLRLQAWEQQGVWELIQRERRAAFQQETADRLAPLQQRKRKAEDAIVAAFDVCERACQQERDLLRRLEDLKASERAMFELDHAKDQTMSVLKLALANLVMWTRDHYFPASYAQATWHRLAPFFRLPGRIMWGTDTVTVELRLFNDRRLTRDLVELCQRVEAAKPRLPDGRSVVLWVASSRRPPVSVPPCQAAWHTACTSRRAVLE